MSDSCPIIECDEKISSCFTPTYAVDCYYRLKKSSDKKEEEKPKKTKNTLDRKL